jgi:serine/threonine protein kinase/biotin operon repressor
MVSLSRGEIDILKGLCRRTHACSIEELAESTKKSRSHVLTHITALVNLGYVRQWKTGHYKITPRILGRRFLQEKFIGAGSYGQVWKGVDIKLEREIAIKFLHGGRQHFEQLLAEAHALALVEKPDSILVVYDVGFNRKNGWLITEFIEYPTLQSYLADVALKGSWLSLEDAKLIVEQCLEAMGYAHSRGIVHGDIKPANIFISRANKIKLGDFGVARILSQLSERRGCQHGSEYKRRLGSPTFCAPEVLRGSRPTYQSDLFSMGILAYILFSGVHPFLHRSGLIPIPELIKSDTFRPRRLRHIRRDVGKRFDQIIMGLLEKEEAERPQRTTDVLNKWREEIDVIRCLECNVKNSQSSKFCYNCGASLKKSEI